MEVSWKKAEGYSRYLISNLGQVYDTVSRKEVSQVLTGTPQYYYVNAYNDHGQRKLVRVHRLVALAFIEKRGEEFDIVDHIDRNPHNNAVSNLRWVNRSENARNTEASIWVDDTHLKDFTQKYTSPDVAYSYIYRWTKSLGVHKAIERYEEFLSYGKGAETVSWEGEDVYLWDLCETFSLDYYKVLRELRTGKDIWNIVKGVQDVYRYSVELECANGVSMWFKSREVLASYTGCPISVVHEKLRGGVKRLEDFQTYIPYEWRIKTVQGVSGTIEELCNHFGLSKGCVDSRMARQGVSLEEALTTPRQRLKYIKVDGETLTVKGLCDRLGVDNKLVNAYKNRVGCSLEDALVRYGADISNIELEY